MIGIFTPQSMMEDRMNHIVLAWYIRLDVSAGLLSGFGTIMSREWILYAADYLDRKAAEEPDDVDWKIESFLGRIRLFGLDMTVVFNQRRAGESTHEQFLVQNAELSERLAAMRLELDPGLRDDRYIVTDFSDCPPRPEGSAVNPYEPGILMCGPHFPVNLVLIDWYGLDIMHRLQTSAMCGQPPGEQIVHTAYAGMQLIEAVECWPHSPPAAMLAMISGLGISMLFFPRDVEHSMWLRRKLANVESWG